MQMDKKQLFSEIKQYAKDEAFYVAPMWTGFVLLAIATLVPIDIFPSPLVWRMCHCASLALMTGSVLDLLDRLVLEEALERRGGDNQEF